jgi:hypothetical protein
MMGKCLNSDPGSGDEFGRQQVVGARIRIDVSQICKTSNLLHASQLSLVGCQAANGHRGKYEIIKADLRCSLTHVYLLIPNIPVYCGVWRCMRGSTSISE